MLVILAADFLLSLLLLLFLLFAFAFAFAGTAWPFLSIVPSVKVEPIAYGRRSSNKSSTKLLESLFTLLLSNGATWHLRSPLPTYKTGPHLHYTFLSKNLSYLYYIHFIDLFSYFFTDIYGHFFFWNKISVIFFKVNLNLNVKLIFHKLVWFGKFMVIYNYSIIGDYYNCIIFYNFLNLCFFIHIFIILYYSFIYYLFGRLVTFYLVVNLNIFLFIYSFVILLIFYFLICLFICLFLYLFTFINLFIYSFIILLIYLFVDLLFIYIH